MFYGASMSCDMDAFFSVLRPRAAVLDETKRIPKMKRTCSFAGPLLCLLALAFCLTPISIAGAADNASGASEAMTLATEGAGAAAPKPYTFDKAKGTIDWYTFNGYRRYHSECHVCHGPAGMGSSFAPKLIDSIGRIGYEGYLDVVVNGRVSQTASQIMPGFADNLNVMCFIDDIYAYLAARADGVLNRGRPKKEGPKPEEMRERDKACLGF